MKPNATVKCIDFPCTDTNRLSYLVPGVEVDPAKVSILLISEAAPVNPADYYYAGPDALFAQTTLLAFQDAGAQVASIDDILKLGVYLTTAVKCGKTGYGIATPTIENCSHLLEKELALFPNVKVYLLMGDVAIKVGKYDRQTQSRAACHSRRFHLQDPRRRVHFPRRARPALLRPGRPGLLCGENQAQNDCRRYRTGLDTLAGDYKRFFVNPVT